MQTVFVTPIEGGWMVRSDAIDNDQIFRSGSAAEQAAVRLAEALAVSEPTQIKVLLADGTVARRFAVPAAEGPLVSPNWNVMALAA